MTRQIPTLPILVGWPRRTIPPQRVRVCRRHPHGMFDTLDISINGRCWSWWCSCDAVAYHATTQPLALCAGLAHLAAAHDEPPRRHRPR